MYNRHLQLKLLCKLLPLLKKLLLYLLQIVLQPFLFVRSDFL